MKKEIVIVALALAAIALSLGTGMRMSQTTMQGLLTAPKIKVDLCVDFKPANGEWQHVGCTDLLTDAGKDHLKGILGGTITTNLHTKYIAIGNGTEPTASSTVLDSEQTDCGLARVLGDYYDLGTGNWEVNTTFTYTCSVQRVINTTAAFNQASGGTLFAGGAIPTVTLAVVGDQIRVRHIYTVS
jgi:hypothetical protein